MQQEILDYPQSSNEEGERKRNMKTETVLAGVFILGILFKIQHWPFSGVLLLFSLGILAIIYFFLSYYFFSYNNVQTQNTTLSVVGGMFLSFIPVATFLNVLHFPARELFSLVAVIIAPVVFVVVYFMRNQSPSHLRYYYNNMMIRSGVLTLVAILVFLRLVPGQS